METNTALAVVPQHAIQPAAFFTPEQEAMILRNFLGGASKEEAAVLLEIVKRRRLDPFSRQVYFVKRYDFAKKTDVWAIQTSIDGLRTIAERSGRYEGQTKAEWCGKDGAWRDVWLDAEPPAAARVGVYKAGFREPAYGVARLAAYQQTTKEGAPTKFWRQMGDHMLAKCAEALAIRKAFPEDTGGLYITEEMGEEKEDRLPPRRADPAPADNLGQQAAKIAAAAEVLDATIVPPPPPEEHPSAVASHKADVVDALGAGMEATVTKEEVDALWNRAVDYFDGNTSEAGSEWKEAAIRVFGRKVPDPKTWKRWQMRDVERHLFPPGGDMKDIPFAPCLNV